MCGKCTVSGRWSPACCSGGCVGWVALLAGARIDCCYTHTGLDQVTDAGLKAFSAALGSSTTITTVKLEGKWSMCWHAWGRVLVCMRVCSARRRGSGVMCMCGKCTASGCWRQTAPAGCSGVGVGWVTLLVGARIDCWHTHIGFDKVTDAGLKAFSAALGSNSTITTVTLSRKYACLTVFL